jgi:hypothetical protein
MTPKEKAEQLVDLYYPLFTHSMAIIDAKQCALIAVDELIKNQEKITKNLNRHLSIANIEIQDTGSFWQQVKQEIKKL